jgi:hypothetical protein
MLQVVPPSAVEVKHVHVVPMPNDLGVQQRATPSVARGSASLQRLLGSGSHAPISPQRRPAHWDMAQRCVQDRLDPQ